MKLSDVIPLHNAIESVSKEEENLRLLLTDMRLNYDNTIKKFPYLQIVIDDLLEGLDSLCGFLFYTISEFYIGNTGIDRMTSMVHEVIDIINDLGRSIFDFNHKLRTLEDFLK